MPNELAGAVAMSPFVVALTQGAKMTGLPSRFAIVGALVIGVILAWLCARAAWFDLATGEPGTVTLTGVMAGLIASGLWSGTKAVATG